MLCSYQTDSIVRRRCKQINNVRALLNGRVPASQAGCAGPIPVARSKNLVYKKVLWRGEEDGPLSRAREAPLRPPRAKDNLREQDKQSKWQAELRGSEKRASIPVARSGRFERAG